MTKPISRKMVVDCLLDTVIGWYGQLPCRICTHPLLPGQDIQFDHIHADVFGGPHEYQNLRPVHAECHKKKTARDVKANAKIKRIRGETKTRPKRKMPKQVNPWRKKT